MLNSIDAVFDGKVFHPEQPVTLKANTRVRIVIDNLSDENNELTSFLETAESLQLDGPSDWSENLDKYLYGEEKEYESWEISRYKLRDRFIFICGRLSS